MGFANKSHMFYRHFSESPNSTYIYTVSPLAGNPVLLIGISSSNPIYPQMNDFSTAMIQVNSPNSKLSNVTQYTLTLNERIARDPYCQPD